MDAITDIRSRPLAREPTKTSGDSHGDRGDPPLLPRTHEERRRYGLARIRRQSLAPHAESSPLTSPPDVSTTHIMCADDRAPSPRYQRHMAYEQPGIEPIQPPDPTARSRPAALPDVLTELS